MMREASNYRRKNRRRDGISRLVRLRFCRTVAGSDRRMAVAFFVQCRHRHSKSVFPATTALEPFPLRRIGLFEMNSVGQSSQVYVAYNGPRYDENPPAYNVWGFHFYWPNGAPAGVTINFNAMCEIRESK